MKTDDRTRDLKRQHEEFIAGRGYDLAHNRRAGGAARDRRERNKKRRQRTRAILRAVLA